MAILFREAEEVRFAELILNADCCRISAANFVELGMVVESQLGPDGSRQCDAFLRRAGIVIEPVTVEQAQLARQAYLDFGNGRHPAGLNFSDCFAYALARTADDPLLYKGADFAGTNVRAAAGPWGF